ncbi:MAG: PilZ domain-containing protein [Candidatus Omnitrophota bacterium]
MKDHRKISRWQINQLVTLKVGEAPNEVYCQVKDINSKGVKITLNTKLPQGSKFKINLRLSESCTVDAEVWIAWHKVLNGVNHYGLFFSKIKDLDKDKIFKFVNMYRYGDLRQRPELDAHFEDDQGGEEMNDHRVFERFQKQFSARFIGLDGRERQAQTFDVSAKGLGLSTADKLESNTPLEIWLDVPHSTDPLYTRGQVVWTKLAGAMGYRSGVELERADLMGISRLLRA